MQSNLSSPVFEPKESRSRGSHAGRIHFHTDRCRVRVTETIRREYRSRIRDGIRHAANGSIDHRAVSERTLSDPAKSSWSSGIEHHLFRDSAPIYHSLRRSLGRSSSFFCVRREFLFGQRTLCPTLIREGGRFVWPNVDVADIRTQQIAFSCARQDLSNHVLCMAASVWTCPVWFSSVLWKNAKMKRENKINDYGYVNCRTQLQLWRVALFNKR